MKMIIQSAEKMWLTEKESERTGWDDGARAGRQGSYIGAEASSSCEEQENCRNQRKYIRGRESFESAGARSSSGRSDKLERAQETNEGMGRGMLEEKMGRMQRSRTERGYERNA